MADKRVVDILLPEILYDLRNRPPRQDEYDDDEQQQQDDDDPLAMDDAALDLAAPLPSAFATATALAAASPRSPYPPPAAAAAAAATNKIATPAPAAASSASAAGGAWDEQQQQDDENDPLAMDAPAPAEDELAAAAGGMNAYASIYGTDRKRGDSDPDDRDRRWFESKYTPAPAAAPAAATPAKTANMTSPPKAAAPAAAAAVSSTRQQPLSSKDEWDSDDDAEPAAAARSLQPSSSSKAGAAADGHDARVTAAAVAAASAALNALAEKRREGELDEEPPEDAEDYDDDSGDAAAAHHVPHTSVDSILSGLRKGTIVSPAVRSPASTNAPAVATAAAAAVLSTPGRVPATPTTAARGQPAASTAHDHDHQDVAHIVNAVLDKRPLPGGAGHTHASSSSDHHDDHDDEEEYEDHRVEFDVHAHPDEDALRRKMEEQKAIWRKEHEHELAAERERQAAQAAAAEKLRKDQEAAAAAEAAKRAEQERVERERAFLAEKQRADEEQRKKAEAEQHRLAEEKEAKEKAAAAAVPASAAEAAGKAANASPNPAVAGANQPAAGDKKEEKHEHPHFPATDVIAALHKRRLSRLISHASAAFLKHKVKELAIDHTCYMLTRCLMMGMKAMLHNYAESSNNGALRPHHFRRTITYEFPNEGSPLTMPHMYSPFEFKDYCGDVFASLRHGQGITPEDYMASIGEPQRAPLIDFISNSKSGTYFFYSHDKRYLIKSLSAGEVAVLRKMLPNYYKHVTGGPTLLSSLCGLHRITLKGPPPKDLQNSPHGAHTAKAYVIVMRNVFHGERPIHRRYDLKGSTVGRRAKPEERRQLCPVLKDLDWIEAHESLRLGPVMRDSLLATLRRDCMFLSAEGIMDYSLLVGIHSKSRYKADMAALAKARAALAASSAAAAIGGAQDADAECPADILAAELNALHAKHGYGMSINMRHWTEQSLKDGAATVAAAGSKGAAVPHEGDERARSATQYQDGWGRPRDGSMSQVGAPPSKNTRDEDEKHIADEKQQNKAGGAQQKPNPAVVNVFGAGGIDSMHGNPPGPGDECYYLGVIDILQLYNKRKAAEHFFKSFVNDATQISCVNPQAYADRFVKFIEAHSM